MCGWWVTIWWGEGNIKAVLFRLVTSQKVAGSNHDGVFGNSPWHNPSGCTMTQPPTEMSTRIISLGVKVTGAFGWQTYHLHVPLVLKSGSLKLLETLGPVQVCNGIDLLSISLGNTVLTFCWTDWLRKIWCTSAWMDSYTPDFRTEQLMCRRQTRYHVSRRGSLHILRWREWHKWPH